MKQEPNTSGLEKCVVEHIWSKERNSKIFEAIFGYFQELSPRSSHISSLSAEGSTADFRLYHRPQLEDSVINPCGAVIHHDLHDPTSEISLEELLPIYRQCDILFCLNQTQAQVLNDAGLSQTTVIPHGYHPDLLRVKSTRQAATSPPWTLGIFSRRYPNLVKGEAFLYELIRHLSPDVFNFILIGQDRDKDAHYLNMQGFDAVQKPHTSYADFISTYRDIDALLILSVAEGGPASVPESLAAGVPIIARPVGMVPDLPAKAKDVLTLTDNPAIDAAAIQSFLSKGENIHPRNGSTPSYIYPWADIIGMYETKILACLNLASTSAEADTA